MHLDPAIFSQLPLNNLTLIVLEQNEPITEAAQ
jgi:hypothetical protein